jgi:hypothetical protein
MDMHQWCTRITHCHCLFLFNVVAVFRFPELEQHEPPNFFSNLYESYRRSYEKYKAMMEQADFHPVEDFKNFMANTTQQIIEAEEWASATATQTAETAMATATLTAESAMNTATQTATQMYEIIIQPVGQTLIQPGSDVEKRLSAIGQATATQLIHAFNSVKQGMTERLETAKILSTQRAILRRQLVGYRKMLDRLREMSAEVPSKQMAVLMRRITESNQALERLEARAKDAFDQATGYARKNLPFPPSHQPQRYAKYSSDPLLGVATYPLGRSTMVCAHGSNAASSPHYLPSSCNAYQDSTFLFWEPQKFRYASSWHERGSSGVVLVL